MQKAVGQGVKAEQKPNVAPKLDFYQLIWIFAVSCVVGFLVETLWCYIKHGYIESRQSLVYGPISIVYGMGAIVLTLALYRFQRCSWQKIFWISFAVGTVTEYIASLGEEIVFGVRAWDYSHLPLNINGRVCLLYSLFWGVLGLAWVKAVYPFLARLIAKIPSGLSKAAVWLFLVFFVFDCVLSASAAVRMAERETGAAPSNRFEEYLDSEFPDERMRRIYANSEKVDK